MKNAILKAYSFIKIRIKVLLYPKQYKKAKEIVENIERLLTRLPDEQNICVVNHKASVMVDGYEYFLQVFRSKSREEHYEKIRNALLYNQQISIKHLKKPEKALLTSIPDQLIRKKNPQKLYLYYCGSDQKGSRCFRLEEEFDNLTGGLKRTWLSDIAVVIK